VARVQRELAALCNLAGATELVQHRLDEAAAHYQAELQLHQAPGDRQAQGITYHQLGVVAEDQRRFAEAEAGYRQALDIFEFGDRHSAASTYFQLGRVAEEQRRFAEAEASYGQALVAALQAAHAGLVAKLPER
jgi:tetratricopeptide (TPR) repeat protein